MKKTTKILIVIAVIAGIAILTVPISSVFAHEDVPPDIEEQQENGGGWFRRPFVKRIINFKLRSPKRPMSLEAQYAKLVDRYEDVGYRIEDTDDVVYRLEERIEALTDEDEDASEVQTILDTFLENMTIIEEAYDELGELISQHEGFDDDGEIIDEDRAFATLRSIAEGLLNIHQLSEDTRFELRWDLKAYHYKNTSEE